MFLVETTRILIFIILKIIDLLEKFKSKFLKENQAYSSISTRDAFNIFLT